jgi:hypothetical protein
LALKSYEGNQRANKPMWGNYTGAASLGRRGTALVRTALRRKREKMNISWLQSVYLDDVCQNAKAKYSRRSPVTFRNPQSIKEIG